MVTQVSGATEQPVTVRDLAMHLSQIQIQQSVTRGNEHLLEIVVIEWQQRPTFQMAEGPREGSHGGTGGLHGAESREQREARREARRQWLQQQQDAENAERMRLSREERRALRLQIREAGYQLYMPADGRRHERAYSERGAPEHAPSPGQNPPPPPPGNR